MNADQGMVCVWAKQVIGNKAFHVDCLQKFLFILNYYNETDAAFNVKSKT